MVTAQSDIHILLLEDDPHLRRGISLALELQKFRVHQAGHGRQGLELMRHHQPDLIISDINMPIMDGVQFLQAVRPELEADHIPFVFLTGKDAAGQAAGEPAGQADDFITKPINTVNLLKVIYTNLLKAVEARHRKRNAAFRQEVLEIAVTLESRDSLTDGHILRVTEIADRMGHILNLPHSRLETLSYSAMLHDLGKITIPDHLLNKASSLNAKEWKLIQQHTVEGAAIVSRISLLANAAPHILAHHEKWDGSGYPEGLRGKEIPVEARILTLADAFERMTSDRPYREALSVEEAQGELRSRSGKDFDPDLVEKFLEQTI